MKKWVLSDMTVATERSQRDLSIGEVKIDVWVDYPSQKTIQSIDFGGSSPILHRAEDLVSPRTGLVSWQIGVAMPLMGADRADAGRADARAR